MGLKFPPLAVRAKGFVNPRVHGAAITHHVNKASKIETLPSRHALTTLTGGNPVQRSLQQYAKLTPTGASAPGTYADIEHMGEKASDTFDG